jgi:hypothetical protein
VYKSVNFQTTSGAETSPTASLNGFVFIENANLRAKRDLKDIGAI